MVEPDSKSGDRGAIYLWIEEIDDNNVPDGVPRSYRLPYSRPLADRSARARDEIMKGKPQQGSAEDIGGEETKDAKAEQSKSGSRTDSGLSTVDLDAFQLLQQAQRVEFRPMPGPKLPPKVP